MNNTKAKESESILEDFRQNIIKQRDECLSGKNYIVTGYQTGDKLMSGGDYKREVNPRRWYSVVSIDELPEIISQMKYGFYQHKDIGTTNEDEIPFKEKKWGMLYNIVIEPLSEELEKSYLDGSKKGFFKTYRELRDSGILNRGK